MEQEDTTTKDSVAAEPQVVHQGRMQIRECVSDDDYSDEDVEDDNDVNEALLEDDFFGKITQQLFGLQQSHSHADTKLEQRIKTLECKVQQISSFILLNFGREFDYYCKSGQGTSESSSGDGNKQ